MKDSNSAAQVSTRLKIASIPSASRRVRTAAAVLPTRLAMCSSEKPTRLASRSNSEGKSLPAKAASFRSQATISSSWRRNHGSMAVICWISSRLIPWRMAANNASNRSGVGVTSSCRSRSSASRGKLKRFPVSSERIPFKSASLKVRPMAITSPTERISVPSVRSAPGNFSNCHLGIFTTT